MMSNIQAPTPIVVPSPAGQHQHDSLPLPSATPGGRPSSRGNLLEESSHDVTRTEKAPVSGEVHTLRMLFGGSICLLLLCISMLIIVSVVPLRNAAMPVGINPHHSHVKGMPGPGRMNPFHLTDGPLGAFGSIDGMVLQGMATADGTLIERYYRIQRVTRIPQPYQVIPGSEESTDNTTKSSVRIEFFGGDFLLADHMSAALFRRRDVADEKSELECAPLKKSEEGVDEDTTDSSVYCAVALLLNPETIGDVSTQPEEHSSNHTRGLQARTAIHFPYRDGINYPSAYGFYTFNTGSLYGADGSSSFWGYPNPRSPNSYYYTRNGDY